MIHEIRLEQEGANDRSAVVLGWSVTDGQHVGAGAVLLEVETSKVRAEIAAPRAGWCVPVATGSDEVRVGEILAYLCTEHAELPEARARTHAGSGPDASVVAAGAAPRFSAAAAAYAQRNGIPPEAFAGRSVVTLPDVQAVAAVAGGGAEPLGRAKALEVDRLTAANVLNASLAVQFDGTVARRRAAAAPVPSVRLLAIVVHAVASSLARFPGLNAWYDGGLRRHASIGVGVAIDLDDQLKVGVVHDADRLGPAAIERRIGELVSRYLDDALTVADVTGGSLTVSDLSMEDVLSFQPLLNAGQALAVGLGGDRGLPGSPLTLSVTFDHRVTTGREVSQFLTACRRLITEETP